MGKTLEECQRVFESGMLLTDEHLSSLRILASNRENEGYADRADEWGLEMTRVSTSPRFNGARGMNLRVVGVYPEYEAGLATFMWLHHFNVTRSLELNIKLEYREEGANKPFVPIIKYDIFGNSLRAPVDSQKPTDSVHALQVPYASSAGRYKRQKLPLYTVVYPTVAGRQQYSAKQRGSVASLKWRYVQPGITFGELREKWKQHSELRGRLQLDWDIRRGYVHIVPA